MRRILIVVVAVVGCNQSTDTAPTTPQAARTVLQAKPTNRQDVLSMPIASMGNHPLAVWDFKSNEAAADVAREGKAIEVFGIVTEVTKSGGGYILWIPGDGYSGFEARLVSFKVDGLERIQAKDTRATIVGIYETYKGGKVYLTDCVVKNLK